MTFGTRLPSLALIALLIPGLVCETSCSASTESAAFAAIIIASDGLVTALGVTGTIPPADVAPITTIVNATATAAQETITEQKSTTDTAAQKTAKILGYWNGVLSMIGGLPPNVQALLAVITSSINAYVQAIAPPTVTAAIVPLSSLSTMQRMQFHYEMGRRSAKVAKLRSHLATVLAK